MEAMKVAAETGKTTTLYNLIGEDPYILEKFDSVPFIDTPLHVAAKHGHTHFAMEMVSLKPSFFNKLNTEGLSPLHVALQNGKTDLALQLLAANHDLIPCRGREGIVPIHYVAQEGSIDLLKRFLTASPKSIQDVTRRRESVLHVTLKNNKLDAFYFLVGYLRLVQYEGSSIQETEILNRKDDEGNTILHIAVTKNNPEVVQLLINCGVEINTKNTKDMTALDILYSQRDNQEVRKMLVAVGALKASNLTIEITSTGDHLRPMLSFKERLIISIIRFKRDIAHDTRNALLVIVVLIATVTCQGSLTPPGGVWQDSNSSTTQVHHAGKVIMSNISFLFFWFLNSITLWTTELAFFFLVDGRFSKLLFMPVYLFSQCYTLSLSLVSPSPAISMVIIMISIALPLVVFMSGYCVFHRVAKKLKTDVISLETIPLEKITILCKMTLMVMLLTVSTKVLIATATFTKFSMLLLFCALNMLLISF